MEKSLKSSKICQDTVSQAAEKLNPEGDGGFNPRIKPIE
jgi:hypothetical protein